MLKIESDCQRWGISCRLFLRFGNYLAIPITCHNPVPTIALPPSIHRVSTLLLLIRKYNVRTTFFFQVQAACLTTQCIQSNASSFIAYERGRRPWSARLYIGSDNSERNGRQKGVGTHVVIISKGTGRQDCLFHTPFRRRSTVSFEYSC